MKFLPNGELVAITLDAENTGMMISFWNLTRKLYLKLLGRHSPPDGELIGDISPDGELVGFISNGILMLYDLATGVQLETPKHPVSVKAIAISPEKDLLASVVDTRVLNIWDLKTGLLLRILEKEKPDMEDLSVEAPTWSMTVTFSLDGKRIATSDWKTVELWDCTTGLLLQTIRGHWGPIVLVTFLPDGKPVTIAMNDHSVKLWDSTKGNLLQTFTRTRNYPTDFKLASYPMHVAISPDCKLLAISEPAICYTLPSVSMWDIATGTALWIRSKKHMKNRFISEDITFLPDGETVAVADNGIIQIWDSFTGAALQIMDGHLTLVDVMRISSDGKLMALVSGNAVRLWDSAARENPPDTSERLSTAWSDELAPASMVLFSPNGRMAASAASTGPIKLWNPNTGALLQILESSVTSIESIYFSPDSTLLAMASVISDSVSETVDT
ncbi:Cirhin [Dactylellina cionopaga]|nr:Cirhin [Dactylellina cionopaga]